MSNPEQNNQLKELLRKFCLGVGKVKLEDAAANWSVQAGVGSIAFDYGCVSSENSSLNQIIQSNNLTTKFWFQTQLEATKNIVKSLNDAGVTPTILKGMSTSTSIYPKPHYRMMRDIDILIDSAEIEQAEKTLPALGYKQTSSLPADFYKTHHHTMPWQHKEKDVWLEVHQALFTHPSPCSSSPAFKLDNIKSEKVLDDFYALKTYRLSYSLQIIYIASHWAEQFKQIGGTFALLDTALLINQHNDELDWDKIIAWSNASYIVNYVYLTLHYLHRNGFLKASVDIKGHINRMPHSLGFFSLRIMNKIIDNYIFKGKPFGRLLTVNNVGIIWRHLLTPRSDMIKLVTIPLAIIFPKDSDKKFNLYFQFLRFLSMFKSRRS